MKKTTLKDDKNFLWLPDKLRNYLMKHYQSQGFIYIKNVKGKDYPSKEMTTIVKWLDIISVDTFSQRYADKMMFNYFNTTYPEYKGIVNLF